MAWWWSSQEDASNSSVSPVTVTETSPSEKQHAPSLSPPSEPTFSSEFDFPEPAKDRPLTRDEQALKELREAFASSPITIDGTPKHIAARPPAPSDEDSFYPSTMSCRQAFDAAYVCSGLAGQARNLYRYGGVRGCDELWYAWRFCIRTKAMDKEEARHRIREWNKSKAARRKLGRNSEEVWEMRREPVEMAFVRRARGEGVHRDGGQNKIL
ncbi:MAG: hypothetical protein M1828_003181 [Chrysothrix sp. TS-e1954]|nr:MAG: hypothetical protein M1828_003181 [Chrysothrix sp. TS-e1954]